LREKAAAMFAEKGQRIKGIRGGPAKASIEVTTPNHRPGGGEVHGDQASQAVTGRPARGVKKKNSSLSAGKKIQGPGDRDVGRGGKNRIPGERGGERGRRVKTRCEANYRPKRGDPYPGFLIKKREN